MKFQSLAAVNGAPPAAVDDHRQPQIFGKKSGFHEVDASGAKVGAAPFCSGASVAARVERGRRVSASSSLPLPSGSNAVDARVYKPARTSAAYRPTALAAELAPA